MKIFAIVIMMTNSLVFTTRARAVEDVRTVQLKIEYRILECSYHKVFQYPCKPRLLRSEEVSFVLDQCVEMGQGRFCDASWDTDWHVVEGFPFKAAIVVQDYLENSGLRETTIYGWMKFGKLPDSSEMNFSLFIDSGQLRDPARVNGVTLAKPEDEKQRIFTFTPTLKISPVEN